jgi:hypothetical protein
MALWERGRDAVDAIVDEINVELKTRGVSQGVICVSNCGEIAALDRAREIGDNFLTLARSVE